MWIYWVLGIAATVFALKVYLNGRYNKHKPDMSGKVVVLNGGTAGLGRETGLELAVLGAKVIITGRDPRGVVEYVNEAAVKAGKPAQAEFHKCDLADLNNVRQLADQLSKRFTSIDMLINNAALGSNDLNYTKQGFESSVGVNLIGPSYMTHCLLPLIRQSKEGRVINVGSDAYLYGNQLITKSEAGLSNWEDFLLQNLKVEEYNIFKAYFKSKLGNMYFTRKLAEVLQAKKV